MKKPSLLAILFLVPIVIILFLKIFGVSHFSIPVYYADEMPTDPCESVSLPYKVSGDIAGMKGENEIYSYAFLNQDQDTPGFVAELVRLIEKFRDAKDVNFILLMDTSIIGELKDADRLGFYESGWDVIKMSNEDFENIYTCQFFLPQSTEEGAEANTVLLDEERRIRGYYDLYVREETDRLSAELKILRRDYTLEE